jgi:hypothetical protein
MKKLLGYVALAAVVFAGYYIYTNYIEYGKRIKINDHLEVYMKGKDVTEDEAKKLGNFFAESWKDDKGQKSLQLMKENGTYVVKMVVDEKKLKADSTLDESFTEIRTLIEQQIFKRSKVRLTLTDDQLKDIKSFDEHSQPSNSKDSSTVK